jgi:hypothetical protein
VISKAKDQNCGLLSEVLHLWQLFVPYWFGIFALQKNMTIIELIIIPDRPISLLLLFKEIN